MLFTIYTMNLAPIIMSAVLAKTEMATIIHFKWHLDFFLVGARKLELEPQTIPLLAYSQGQIF